MLDRQRWQIIFVGCEKSIQHQFKSSNKPRNVKLANGRREMLRDSIVSGMNLMPRYSHVIYEIVYNYIISHGNNAWCCITNLLLRWTTLFHPRYALMSNGFIDNLPLTRHNSRTLYYDSHIYVGFISSYEFPFATRDSVRSRLCMMPDRPLVYPSSIVPGGIVQHCFYGHSASE